MADMRSAFDAMDGIIKLANNANNIGPRDIRQSMQVGVPRAEKMARGFLGKNYRRSGLKVRTGQLIGMVRRAALSIVDPVSSRVALVLSMPAGMTKQDNTKASSVNYGSVRDGKGSLLGATGATGRKLIGERQRRNLKSFGQATKGSEAFQQVSRDVGVRGVGTTKNGSAVLDTTAGRATVTKAWKYFFLTDSQLEAVKSVIFNSAMEHLMAKISGKRAIRRAA
jgi:hypothetical protein